VHGRAAERARIEGLLADARSGQSGALVICGAAGSGKTALLAHAIERSEGFDVLQTTGIEAESQISFSGLDELLSPVVELVDEIPEPQREAFRAAFDLAPSAKLARGAVFRAVFSVLAAAAESRPILCVIDDAEMVDPASASALAFAARRVKVEGIAMLFAVGGGGSGSFAGLERLYLDGLDAESARELLEERACAKVAPEVARRITDAAGGNPRALVDAAAALSADELAGRAPLPTRCRSGPQPTRGISVRPPRFRLRPRTPSSPRPPPTRRRCTRSRRRAWSRASPPQRSRSARRPN